MTTLSYEFRPTKGLVRTILVEVLSHLAPLAPLSEYQYVGFGAIEFMDFEAIHRTLGIHRLISIEQDSTIIPRCQFNRPYKGITIEPGNSLTVLPTLNWAGLSIVWLDYTCSLNREVIADITYLSRVLIPGSVLAVTLNCHPTKPVSDRLAQLEEQLGAERIPAGVTDATLGEWGMAETQALILDSELRHEVGDRGDGATWRPLLNLQYRDSARMQLMAGVVGAPAADRILEVCRFDDVPEVRSDGSAVQVRVPLLTHKERAWLNERLPHRTETALPRPRGVSRQDAEDYASIYRRFPAAIAGY